MVSYIKNSLDASRLLCIEFQIQSLMYDEEKR